MHGVSSNAANETPAADLPDEDDYQTFYAVLAESARGRAFLAEHARRARQADTNTLVAAFERLETRLATQLAAAAVAPAAPVTETPPVAVSERPVTAIPEVMLFEPPGAVETPAAAIAPKAEIVETVTDTAVVIGRTAEPPRDPLAAVMALTDEERIALFT